MSARPLVESLEVRRLLSGDGGSTGGGGIGGGEWDDNPPEHQVSISADHVILQEEDSPIVTFTVARQAGPISEKLVVGLELVDLTGINRTATPGEDFEAPPASVTIEPNEPSATFTVSITDDDDNELQDGEEAPIPTQEFFQVRAKSTSNLTGDHSEKVRILDASRYYYTDWEKTFGRDSLVGGNVALGTVTEEPYFHPGVGTDPFWERRVEHYYFYDVWIPKNSLAQSSGAWMNDEDEDGIDDNDVSFPFEITQETSHSFSVHLDGEAAPVTFSVFDYTASWSNTSGVAPVLAANADDNERVHVVPIVKERIYEKRVDVQRQDYDGNPQPTGTWETVNVHYDRLLGGMKQKQVEKLVFKIKRYWLDPDDDRVPSLFTQSKHDQPPIISNPTHVPWPQ